MDVVGASTMLVTAYKTGIIIQTTTIQVFTAVKILHLILTVNMLVSTDRTPMHLAAENGHATIIELLADKFKASIFERTKDGSTLMHIASLNGHAECAMMLFKKGVYLHMPNKVTALLQEQISIGTVNTLCILHSDTVPGRCKKHPYCCAVWPCWDHQHTSSERGKS
jgi:hypothetical protein